MSDRVFVGTRKGLFELARRRDGWDIADVSFLGDPVTLLANVVSGDVEAALPDGLSVEMAKDLQQGWAAPGSGNNVILSYDGRLFRL